MNITRLLMYALLNNETITSELAKSPEGYPLINPVKVPVAKYPLVEFHEIGGGDVVIADEEVYIDRSVMQLTVYGDYSEEFRQALVDTVRSLDFKIIHRYEQYQRLTGITHTVWHFRLFITQDYYDQMMAYQEKLYNENYPDDFESLPSGEYYDEKLEKEIYVEPPWIDEEDVDQWEFYGD